MRIRGRKPAMALTEDEPPTALPRMHSALPLTILADLAPPQVFAEKVFEGPHAGLSPTS